MLSFVFAVGEQNETLSIMNVTRNKDDLYWCSARNTRGQRTSPKLTLQAQCELL